MERLPGFPRFPVFWFCLLWTASCAPHQPWDRSVPVTARTRWQRGEAMFRSLEKKIKPLEPEKTSQDPEVRDAAEAALLCITAHVRLLPDPRRKAQLQKYLRHWGFSFAANALQNWPPRETSPEILLRRRAWNNLERFYPLGSSLQKASDETLGRLALEHAESLSGASGIWALELAHRGHAAGLDCPSWMKIANSARLTHSEKALSSLWPLLLRACLPNELAIPIQRREATPEWVRLYEAHASFSDRIRLCTTAGMRFDPHFLREAYLREKSDSSGLAMGFLCAGEKFLEFDSKIPEERALLLHFSGKTQEALEYLEPLRPENDFSGRTAAARLALHFGDTEAALGHWRWAAALAQTPLERAFALAQLEIFLRMEDEETWTLLQEHFRLDPRRTGRELWLAGHWPALVLLSGQAPLPWRDEAAFALQRFVDCNPQETPDSKNPLIASWRRLMGPEELRRVWPASKTPARACHALPKVPSKVPAAAPPKKAMWRGDFASDLARMLALEFPPETWKAFYARHVHDPRLMAAAELEMLLYPGSFPHARMAAAAFAWKNDPQRALALLEDAAQNEMEPVRAWKEAAYTMLDAGYRHEAAKFMHMRHEWLTAFAGPDEARRSDMRLEAADEAIQFLWMAGFTAEAKKRLETLLEDARRASPLQGARMAEHLARRHPDWFTTASLLRFTNNPLFFLEWALVHPDARKLAAHILSQMSIVLPNAPELFWLACALLEDESACLKAHARGIGSEIRLELALDLLDSLQKLNTVDRPADERLAIHAAWRRAKAHPAWRYVLEELLAPPQ